MKHWLNAPVTRGEVIGWALAFPVVLSIWGYGAVTLQVLPNASWLVAKYPDLTPAFLRLCVSLGVGGLVVVYGLCALLALGAQVSKQRPLVRMAAPVICFLLARAVNEQFFSSWRDLLKHVPTADGQATLDQLRR